MCTQRKKTLKTKPWVESCGNIYKDLGFNDEEAANLMVRAALLLQLQQIIKDKQWTQEEAAKTMKVKQPRVAEIMSLKTDCFSVDLLLKYLARLGKRVEVTVKDVSQVA
jgi:predicted XRE-type DNA-binding protein